jgi:hypothetical protein
MRRDGPDVLLAAVQTGRWSARVPRIARVAAARFGELRFGLTPEVGRRQVGLRRGAMIVLAVAMLPSLSIATDSRVILWPSVAATPRPLNKAPHSGNQHVPPGAIVFERSPRDARGYHSRCYAKLVMGEFQRAIVDCTKAIRLKPDLAEAYDNRGVANLQTGDPVKAITDFTETLRLKPDHEHVYNNRGRAYYVKGDLELAIKDFDQAIKLDSKYALAFDNRGLAWRDKGQLAHAVDDFEQARQVEPTNAIFKKHLEAAKDAQDALAPGSGPYIKSSALDSAFSEVETALVLPLDLDDRLNISGGESLPLLAIKRKIWMEIRPFVNEAGLDPVSAIVDAIRENRIVGIGEQHATETNLNILFALEHMPEFAAAGLTDLFIEIPSAAQPIFDKFNDSPFASADIALPDRAEQLTRLGIDRNIAEGTLTFLRFIKSQKAHYQLWKAAKAAGIRLHAIDNALAALAWLPHDDRRTAKLEEERDRDMMTAMLAVLDQPVGATKVRKGMAWLGLSHLTDTHSAVGDNAKSAFELLRAKGQRVITFSTQVGVNAQSETETLFTVARYVDRAVAVPTKSEGGVRNPLSSMNPSVVPNSGYNDRLDAWDFAILYPHHCSWSVDNYQRQRFAC